MNRNGPLPEDSERSARPALPANLAAVQADDALLDALRGPNPSPKGDAWLMQTLMAWRDKVDAEPLPRLVDTDTALAAVATGRHRRAGFWSQLRAALARDRWPWRKGA